MPNDTAQLGIARERLATLRGRVEDVVADPSKPRRVKDMELAGIRGMIEQIEAEVHRLEARSIREHVGELRMELATGDAQALTRVIGGTLDLVERLAAR